MFSQVMTDGAVVLLASATVILFFLFCMMFFVSVDTITLQL